MLSMARVKPLPLIFIYDTGPSLPSLFQISEECEFSARICYSKGPELFCIQKKEYDQSIGSMTTQLTNAMEIVENHRGISRSDIPCISIKYTLHFNIAVFPGNSPASIHPNISELFYESFALNFQERRLDNLVILTLNYTNLRLVNLVMWTVR